MCADKNDLSQGMTVLAAKLSLLNGDNCVTF